MVNDRPLDATERTQLFRILSDVVARGVGFAPRKRMALEAYVEVLTSAPFSPGDVALAARAVLRAWNTPAFVASEMILAELLELPPSAMTQPLSPRPIVMINAG